MAIIQVTVPDQQLKALESKAKAVNLTVDELLKQAIETILTQSADTNRAMEYVLAKNKTLYERLA